MKGHLGPCTVWLSHLGKFSCAHLQKNIPAGLIEYLHPLTRPSSECPVAPCHLLYVASGAAKAHSEEADLEREVPTLLLWESGERPHSSK